MARYQIIFMLFLFNFSLTSFSQTILTQPYKLIEIKETGNAGNGFLLSQTGDWLLNFITKQDEGIIVSKLMMHDTQTGDVLWEVENVNGKIWDAAFSPDSKYIAVLIQKDGFVIFYDTLTGSFVKSLQTGITYLFDIVFSPDGKLMAVTSHREGIFVYDLRSSTRVIQIYPQTVNWYNVTAEDVLPYISGMPPLSVNFHPNSQFILACSSSDRSARIWDIETGEWIHTFIHPNPYQFGPVLSIFNADGDTMISMDQNSTLYLWDVKTEELKHSINIFKNTYLSNIDSFRGAFARSIVITPKSNLFFIGGDLSGLEDARLAFFFDTETDEIKYQIDYSEEPLFVGLTSNGNLLVTRILNKLKFWDTSFIFKDHIRNWKDYR